MLRGGLAPVLAMATCLATAVIAPTAGGQGPAVTVAGWNLESGDSDITVLTSYLRDANTPPTVDVWGFSEVDPSWPDALERALDRHGRFRLLVGTTGRNDRMVIAFDEDVFELLVSGELHYVNIGGSVRAPLFARLRHRATRRSLFFVVNHLYRSNESARHEQATALNRWASRLQAPVVAVGDYNFDWEVDGGEDDHDAGYDRMTASDVFSWLRPPELRRTQCGSNYQSVLDFVFAGGAARQWAGRSWIESSHPAFCPSDADDQRSSDHRPVLASFTL